MYRSLILLSLLGVVASLGVQPRAASAETFSAAAGTQNFGDDVCFRWVESSGSIGVQRSSSPSCAFQSFVVPLYWHNFYSSGTYRTVEVRGRRSSSSAVLACTLYVIDEDGFVASQAYGELSQVGSYSLLPLSVNNVSSTSTSFLACNLSASNAWLMNVQYSP